MEKTCQWPCNQPENVSHATKETILSFRLLLHIPARPPPVPVPICFEIYHIMLDSVLIQRLLPACLHLWSHAARSWAPSASPPIDPCKHFFFIITKQEHLSVILPPAPMLRPSDQALPARSLSPSASCVEPASPQPGTKQANSALAQQLGQLSRQCLAAACDPELHDSLANAP